MSQFDKIGPKCGIGQSGAKMVTAQNDMVTTAPSVAVVAFNGISPFHLTVPCTVFDRRNGAASLFHLQVCSCDEALLQTGAGFAVVTQHGLEVLEHADIIIVPSWRNSAERPPQSLLLALQRANERGVLLIGLCLGAYVLAAAGLLDGHKATTHWAYADDLANRYPAIEIDADVLYIEQGNLLTSAGTAAGIDCCLHVVRKYYGVSIANMIARQLVVAPHRAGGQAQFIEQPLPPTPGDSRIAELMEWVRQQLSQPHSIDSLAGRVLMSRRSFTRHFKQLTGMTVGAWLLNERLTLAQQLLESTDHSIEVIALLAGFGSAVSFRQHFGQVFKVTPVTWRKTFKSF